MPPRIALLLCILFILYLFKIDFRQRTNVSPAIWIPLIWMLIIGSRAVSQWLNLGTPVELPDYYLKGSPLDRNVFLALGVAGFLILSRRRIDRSWIVQNNAWILMFFLYAGISILWSDFPFVSFKRWIKGIANLIMVLLILTEPDPVEAVKTVLRRCAYILIPLSVLFIKYYPHLGRSYSSWTWEPFFHGVALGKNSLGVICFIFGSFFFWNLTTIWGKKEVFNYNKEILIDVLFLFMISWLLKMANSATALVCFIISICILICTKLSTIRKSINYINIYVFCSFFVFLLFYLSFDVIGFFVSTLGRDATFTGRVPLWNELIDMVTNTLIGTGYASFWLGDRALQVWLERWGHPNQAHNGFLEMYLNLGWIGLFFFTGVAVSAYRKTRKELMFRFHYGRFQIAFLVTALIYNITEAVFKGLNLLWFVFLLIAVGCPSLSQPGTTRDNDHSWDMHEGAERHLVD